MDLNMYLFRKYNVHATILVYKPLFFVFFFYFFSTSIMITFREN